MSKLYRMMREYAKDVLLAVLVVFAWFVSVTFYLAATDDPGAIGKVFVMVVLVGAIFAVLRWVRSVAYEDGLDARRNEFDDGEIPF